MSITIKQYLELPLDAVVSMNKDTFVVSRFVDEMELREPVLINRKTGERLHGAIYVTHLLKIDSLPTRTVVSASIVQEANEAEEHLCAIELGDESVSHEAFYCPEVLTGRLEHASLDVYLNELNRLLEGVAA